MTLAVVDPSVCPDCGTPLELEHVDQPAIVRHGGYGATRRTTTRHCPRPGCGWALNHQTSEHRP